MQRQCRTIWLVLYGAEGLGDEGLRAGAELVEETLHVVVRQHTA